MGIKRRGDWVQNAELASAITTVESHPLRRTLSMHTAGRGQFYSSEQPPPVLLFLHFPYLCDELFPLGTLHALYTILSGRWQTFNKSPFGDDGVFSTAVDAVVRATA